ncbi:hypothetical protein DPEC_G00177560 [Dallia pectoralis]|uniref:Uncharacterized protein n=1 Tax=Dallia pectoralis TaxID=75939 RepID=A0ACC2GFD8_DALPE|nr:hypothetical protein DPEC_G00177560 [Dallia pectoralis]
MAFLEANKQLDGPVTLVGRRQGRRQGRGHRSRGRTSLTLHAWICPPTRQVPGSNSLKDTDGTYSHTAAGRQGSRGGDRALEQSGQQTGEWMCGRC